MIILGVDIDVLLTERIVADVYCSGDSVVEFITSSPLYMNKTDISLVPGYTNKYYITLTWKPTREQYGPQVQFLNVVFFIKQKEIINDRYFVLLLSIKKV